MQLLEESEVRLVGESWWAPLVPDSRAWFSLHDPSLWHHQTMRTQETRAWLYWRSKDPMRKDRDLSQRDGNWLLDWEDNETTVLKFVPASGGRPREWRIRHGNYIPLGELLLFGKGLCTCWDMYRTYNSLDIFINRRAHPLSNSEAGILRQNAKRWRFEQVGRWGLPCR